MQSEGTPRSAFPILPQSARFNIKLIVPVLLDRDRRHSGHRGVFIGWFDRTPVRWARSATELGHRCNRVRCTPASPDDI